MTIDEKRSKIGEYCRSMCSCKACVLNQKVYSKDYTVGSMNCLDIYLSPEEDLDKAIELINSTVTTEDTEPTEPTEPTNPTNDIVNHPSHYTHGGMECIDEMITLFGKDTVKKFCLCNAWKYRKRAMYKNGEEDMKKSDWYIAKYKELSTYEYNYEPI